MTDKKFKGYLDRLRENVEVLDEAIANARKMSKPKGKADKAAALQWAKTLRDLIELRGTTLVNIKAHMNGRDETGVVQEPPDLYDENAQVEFERYFRNLMTPWTPNDLKLKCEDCGIESEDVSHHDFQEIKDAHWNTIVKEDADLCPQCVEKRNATRQKARSGETKEAAEPASKHEIEVLLQTARHMIRTLETLPVERRIAKLERLLAERAHFAPGMEAAYEAYVGVLQKALDDAKASLS